MKKKLFFLLIYLCPFLSLAQFNLSGQVLEKDNENPLTGAGIFCPELNKGVLCDQNGKFSMNLPKGKFTIQASFLGSSGKVMHIIMDQDKVLKIVLEKNNVEIGEIVVSSSNSAQEESSRSIETVKAATIHQDGNIHLLDALSNVPGISEMTTGNVRRPVIRGLGGNRILTVVNGIRLENQQWDEEHGFSLPDYGYDRIEIIKGPGSLLYGPEAMNGVLHFVDELPAPQGRKQGDIQTGFSSNDMGLFANAGIKGSKEKWDWKIRCGFRSFSDYRDAHNNRIANSRFSGGSMKLGAGTNRSWGRASLTYEFNKVFYGIVEPNETNSTEMEDYPRELEAPYQDLESHRLISKNLILLGNGNLKVLGGWQLDQRTEFEPGPDKSPEAFTSMKLGSINADIQYELPLNKSFTALAMVQAMNQQNRNKEAKFLIPDADLNDIGGGAILRYRKQDLNLEGGLRADQRMISNHVMNGNQIPAMDLTFNNISWSGGGSYYFYERLLLKASVSNGFRAPNLNELFSYGIKPETRTFETGNSGLSKEVNLQVDGSVAITTKPLSLEFSTWKSTYTGFIFLSPTGMKDADGRPYLNFLQSDASIQGFEASGTIRFQTVPEINLEFAYSHLKGVLSNGDYIPFMPADKIRAAIVLSKPAIGKVKNPYLRAGGRFIQSQTRVSGAEASSGSYTLADLAMGGDFTLFKHQLNVSLVGNNLLNTFYIDHMSRLKTYGVGNMGINTALILKYNF